MLLLTMLSVAYTTTDLQVLTQYISNFPAIVAATSQLSSLVSIPPNCITY